MTYLGLPKQSAGSSRERKEKERDSLARQAAPREAAAAEPAKLTELLQVSERKYSFFLEHQQHCTDI